MPKVSRVMKTVCPTDFAARAAFRRLTSPPDNNSMLAPIPADVVDRVAYALFEGPLSDDEDLLCKQTKFKCRMRRKRSTNDKDDVRYVRQLGQQLPINTIHIPISFRRLAKRQSPPKSDPVFPYMIWNDNTPRRAVSQDGITLIVSFPKLVKQNGVKHLNDAITKYAEIVKPVCGKSNTGEDRMGEYLHRPGQIAGEIRMARYWHALGQEKTGAVMPSSDIIHTGTKLSATCKLFKTLTSLSRRINEAVQVSDPGFYQQLMQLREAVHHMEPVTAAMDHLDPLLFEGREIIFNRLSDFHRDSQDPQLGYVALFAGGDFSGGMLELPDIKLKARLEPGDMVLFRGRVLLHKVGQWDNGQRYSIPHFTHTSLWRHAGMAGPVSVV